MKACPNCDGTEFMSLGGGITQCMQCGHSFQETTFDADYFDRLGIHDGKIYRGDKEEDNGDDA